MKKILLLDFDGVCHSYTSGWKGADVIPDPPVDGLEQFLRAAAKEFQIDVFSSRTNQPGGMKAMISWFENYYPRLVEELGILFPTEKPPAWITLDDRGWQFNGVWPDVQELVAFKPWYLRKPEQVASAENNFSPAGTSSTYCKFCGRDTDACIANPCADSGRKAKVGQV